MCEPVRSTMKDHDPAARDAADAARALATEALELLEPYIADDARARAALSAILESFVRAARRVDIDLPPESGARG